MAIEFLPHTADIKVVLDAADLPALFGEATVLIGQMVAGDGAKKPSRSYTVSLGASSEEELLLEYLRELLLLFESDRFVPVGATVNRASDGQLEVKVSGETFNPERHETQPEVKAVTRHELAVETGPDGARRAVVIFDL